MVEAWVDYCARGIEGPGWGVSNMRGESWGLHRFAVLPRPGDELTIWVHGDLRRVVVHGATHGSRPADGSGPQGEPTVCIRVTPAQS